MSSNLTETRVPLGGRSIGLSVLVAGGGPPLVYLHAAGGFAWDGFLSRLAERYTVYAPLVPGTSPGRPNDIDGVTDLWDLVLIYDEALRSLGLAGAPVIGPSFGGMLACELAAHWSDLFSAVVAIAPVGLWRADRPVANWVATAPQDIPALVFHRPDGDAARAALTLPEDPDASIDVIVGGAWAIGCTAKFVWPIPDKGLSRRLHRVSAPTLVVWGRQDALISSDYAADFAAAIPDCRVALIDDCGHIPQVEQLDLTWTLVQRFLDAPR